MTTCRYPVKCVKEADGTTAERDTGDCSRTEDGEIGGHFDTEA